MAVANSGSRPMRVAVVGEKVAGPAPGLADPAASPAPDVADAAAGPAPDLPDLAASPAPDLADPAAPPAPDLADAVAGRLERGGAEVFRVRLGSHAATGAIGGAAGGLAGDAPSNLPRDLDAGVDCCIVNTEAKVAGIELLESHLAPGAPLLTCCHAASATQTAARCGGPDRVVGFALLAPSDEREAVECARALQTAAAAADAAGEVWRVAGLEPVWVGDGAGLVTPRIVACLANEALFALSEGVADASDIDLAMRLGTRYPRGPLDWAATVGFGQILAIMDALAAEHGEDRYRAAPLLRRLVAAGRSEVT